MKRSLVSLVMVIIGSLILVSSLILLGCSNGSTPTSTTTTPSKTSVTTTQAATSVPATTATKTTTAAPTSTTVTPQSGGTMKIYQPGNIGSLGYPVTSAATDTSLAYFAIDTLFLMNQQGEISPQLATDYKVDPAAKTITITLRKGVKFHDGTDFNAAVCKWNLDLYRTSAKPELKSVSSVDVIDDYTVRLNLSVYQNTLMNQLAFTAGLMISKAAFDTNGKDWCEKNPVGTGAFKFASWDKSIIIKFIRNDQYWGGKPYLDGVNIVFYADATGALMDMKAGNLDMGWSNDPRSVKDLLASGKFYVITRLTGQTPAFTTDNTTDGSPFKDILVRRALSYALDTATMADSFGYGSFKVTNQWAIPGTAYYNPNVVGYPYNPQKAKQLLTAAGYPNGFKTIFHYNAYRASNTDWAAAVQGYLKAVGIDVTLDPMQAGAYNDMAALGKGFTGMLHVMGSPQVDPLLTFANVTTGVEFNGMLKPQEFKDTYAKAVTTADPETKKKLVWDLLAMATDQYCMQNYFWVEMSQLATNIKLKDVNVMAYNRIDASKSWFSK